MHIPKTKQNTIMDFHFTPESRFGDAEFDPIAYDKMRVVLVCLGDGEDAADGLIKLLDVLFSSYIPTVRKFDVLEKEFEIPLSDEIEKGVNEVCNWSQGVFEQGIAQGIEISEARGEVAR